MDEPHFLDTDGNINSTFPGRSENGDGPVPDINREEPPIRADSPPASPRPAVDERQCRICLGGPEDEAELGRLITPCRCKGSIRFVHVQCLDDWRSKSSAGTSFWECNQCHFKYRMARTKVAGLATSKPILGTLTFILFIALVFVSSAVVTYFYPEIDAPNRAGRQQAYPVPNPYYDDDSWYFGYSLLDLPTVIFDLARIAVATFAEVDITDIVPQKPAPKVRHGSGRFKRPVAKEQNTLSIRLLNRFIRGLSLLGVVNFVWLAMSMSLVAPLQMARSAWFRGRRDRGRDGGGTFGTIVIVVVVAVGVLRAIWGVYKFTLYLARLVLQRAETAILDMDGNPALLGVHNDPRPFHQRVKDAIVHELADRMVALHPRRLWERMWAWQEPVPHLHEE